jgi:hypothetical protein
MTWTNGQRDGQRSHKIWVALKSRNVHPHRCPLHRFPNLCLFISVPLRAVITIFKVGAPENSEGETLRSIKIRWASTFHIIDKGNLGPRPNSWLQPPIPLTAAPPQLLAWFAAPNITPLTGRGSMCTSLASQ